MRPRRLLDWVLFLCHRNKRKNLKPNWTTHCEPLLLYYTTLLVLVPPKD